jgi:hypothetical protein
MITPDGILQNLRRAKDGSGSDMAYHYRDLMLAEGWIDGQCNITAIGLVELAKRERAEA